jgi:two-component system CheB/CheR fusion protein
MTPVTPATHTLHSRARSARLREAALSGGPVAQIAVNPKGHLLLANDKARQLFNLAPTDLGRPLQDLEISYRPVELRSHIEAVSFSRTSVALPPHEWRPVGGEPRMLEIQVLPLVESGGALLGVGVCFVDVTLQHLLHKQLDRAGQQLEAASQELQSANEELETMNEELQATIEELETMNDQIQQRSDELRHVNIHLHSMLSSLSAAVVVLSSELNVELWSDKAQELWGLRRDEVQGEPFLSLDIGLPVGTLARPIRDCLDSGPRGTTVLLDGVNRRGRPMRCKVTCTRMGGAAGPATGVMLLMEEARGEAPAGNETKD